MYRENSDLNNRYQWLTKVASKVFEDDCEQHASLKDIYVLNTDKADWEKFFSFLKSFDCELKLYCGDPLPLDKLSYELLENQEQTYLLKVDLGDVSINCHFFTVEEIELDVWTGEVRDAGKAEKVFRFMEGLGEFLKKDVILTPENTKEYVVLMYDHKKQKLECMIDNE